MLKTTFIYTLSDPISGQVRYVGKSSRINKRLEEHIYESYQKKTHKNNWINSLISKNLYPSIDTIDEVPISKWEFWEIYWICQFKAWGFNLVNSTNGGEGNNNQFFSKETREKLSKKFLGEGNPFFNKKHSEETKKHLKNTRKLQVSVNFSKLLESNTNKRKPVIQYDSNGNFIKEWNSIYEAATTLNLIPTKISNVCLGKKHRKTCGGFIWKFK